MQLDLAPLHMRYDEAKQKIFLGPVSELKECTPLHVKIEDMEGTFLDKKWEADADGSKTAYMVFRDTIPYSAEKRCKDEGLRYDITIIPPAMLGREFPKTKGHSSITSNGKHCGELHQVLHGDAWFLLQKTDNERLETAFFIKSAKGGIVIVPPGYEASITNVADASAVIGTWKVSEALEKWDNIKTNKGMSFFFVEGKIVPNENYENIPASLDERETLAPEKLGIEEGQSIASLIEKEGALAFLSSEEAFNQLLEM